MLCKCGEHKCYSDKYDAYYCKTCDEWLEQKCNDEDCEFCSIRPDKPGNINARS